MKLSSFLLRVTLATVLTLGLPSPAATTTPVGYSTLFFAPAKFNVFGLPLHNPAVFAGAVSSVSGQTLSVTSGNLVEALPAGRSYILEINSGEMHGTVEKVTGRSVSQLTVARNLEAEGLAPGDLISVRPAMRLSEIFGANNEAGLKASSQFNPAEADLIYVPDGNGGFDRYYYADYSGYSDYYNADTGLPGNPSVCYTDAMHLLLREDSSFQFLVVSGEVRTEPTIIRLNHRFNYLGTVYPVGVTLGNVGLSDSIVATSNFNPAEADLVYVPQPDGSFKQYYYSSYPGFTGWFAAANGNPGDNVELPSGIVILRRGETAYQVTLRPSFELFTPIPLAFEGTYSSGTVQPTETFRKPLAKIRGGKKGRRIEFRDRKPKSLASARR